MILTLDNLAQKYNCLPSEALERATTFDLHVLDISAKWQEHLSLKSQGLQPAKKVPSQTEMKEMLARVKEQK